MAAGKLNERFAFDRRENSSDGYGNTVASWHQEYACAARRQFLRGGEGMIAARLQGTQTALITVRACVESKAITTEHRARDVRTGDIYNVREAKITEDRAFVELLCEKGVVDG